VSDATARETVLITGASSGLGMEFARLFAADGADLVLVARREEKLRELATELTERHGITCRVEAMDLAEPGAPGQLVQRLHADGVRVDVLVNNAGFGLRGELTALDADRQLAMVQLNVTAVTALTRLLLPGMRQQGRGGILNVASVAGFLPGPRMAVYYASKAYVLNFSEAMAEELRGSGVVVSCLCPGPVKTGFAAVAGMDKSPMFQKAAREAGEVARIGFEGFRAGRVVVLPGWFARSSVWGLRLLPRALARWVSGKMQA